MLSFLKFVPLVLSTAALICLAMVFSACTSTSSPQDLFFMKVNLTEFPKVDHPNLGRSVGIPGGYSSPLQQGNLVDSISGPAENAVGRVSGHVQDLSDRLHSLLPEYYVIGLWSYCEGKRDAQTSSNCSGPSASFSFDLVGLLSNRLSQADGMLPSLTQPVLKGYRQVSHWTVVAYVMAFITTVIAIVAGLVRFPLTKLVAVISSAVSSLLTIGASVTVTVVYQLLTRGINSTLGQTGISSSLGPRMMATTWLAVAFSVGSSLFWIVERCCCCCL